MADVAGIVEDMKAGSEIHFNDLFKVCEHYFGMPRNKGTSHYIFRTPWPGDPRINIQNAKGKAKTYQVRQVLAAIAKLAEIKAKADKDSPEVATDKPERKPPKRAPQSPRRKEEAP